MGRKVARSIGYSSFLFSPNVLEGEEKRRKKKVVMVIIQFESLSSFWLKLSFSLSQDENSMNKFVPIIFIIQKVMI